MPRSLNEIKKPIAKEMELFETRFREAMKSKVPLLDNIMHYIVKRKGKQMRPMFVFLTAGMCGGVTDSTYRAASLIELLHTATLVHDDVVDDSTLRRGFFSINAIWKNKIAVLVGDYLLSKGLLLSVEYKEFDLLQIVSQAVREMSEGELLQIEKARRLDIDESVYYEVIRKKTASLISSCCGCGASSAKANQDDILTMQKFGELIGLAFQIKDDLFDFEDSVTTGKPTGIDIKESKMTLPLIYSLQQSVKSEKREIINIVKNNNGEKEKVKRVLAFIKEKEGIAYAKKKMFELRDEAFLLLNGFAESEYKASLKELVNFTTDRTH